MTTGRRLGVLALTLMLTACSSTPDPPTARSVDLERFMGDWYVIANIPTSMERGAHNAIESYRLDKDGSIATTFTFREGSFDEPEKVLRPRGFVRDPASNAVWGMQFIWPFRSEYLVAHVDADYTETIIARSALDYVWIMARTGDACRAPPGPHRPERFGPDRHARVLPARDARARARPRPERRLDRGVPADSVARDLRGHQGLRAVADRISRRRTGWARA